MQIHNFHDSNMHFPVLALKDIPCLNGGTGLEEQHSPSVFVVTAFQN